MSALFYPLSLAKTQKELLVSGVLEAAAFRQIDFPDEQGGDASMELAIPFLAGMDEVSVSEARIKLRVASKPIDIDRWSITSASGDNEGIVLTLHEPGRLLAVEFQMSPLPLLNDNLHFVVRPITGGNFGPPIFAEPSFSIQSKMFGRILGGLSIQNLDSDRMLVTFPALQGKSWLFQLATGNEATKLNKTAFPATIKRVRVDAAPKNLTVQMAVEPPVTLWQHPDVLFPDAGEQEVSFTPMAGNQLSSALKTGQITLAVPLKFHSDAAGTIEITFNTLSASYVAKPLEQDPLKLRLGGSWIPLRLSAPAARRPFASSARVTAKLLGRELNQGSPVPPPAPPSAGLRVRGELRAATALPFAPAAGIVEGTPLPVVSARAFLEALADAEAVLEIRPDVSSSPGPPAATAVLQIPKGFADWAEFELASPLPVVAGGAPVWIALHVNKGEVVWFASGEGTAKVSIDRGQSWGGAEPQLAMLGAPMAQLFHAISDPQPEPLIRAQEGEAVVMENFGLVAVQDNPKEYTNQTFSLDNRVLSRLAAGQGQGRTSTEFMLFSRSVMDLTFESMVLSYDPFGGVV